MQHVPAPVGSGAPVTEAPPVLPSQAFAAVEPAFAFADPDRRKKLASAFAAVDAIVAEEVVAQKSPGGAFGIVIDGELAYAKGIGVADLERKTQVDADTVFRIGSITKSFTALVALSLRDEGTLSLDDPLMRFVPEAAGLVYPTRDAQPITLRQILTHTAGLPRNARLSGLEAPSEEDVLQSLSGLALERAPGTAHVYSNLGFGLLGIAAARAAHAPFRELVARRLLEPLGMKATVWEAGVVPPNRLARGYAIDPMGQPRPRPEEHFGAAEGGGGLYASVRDLGKYLALQLAAYPPRSEPDRGPVRRSTLRESHTTGFFSGLSVGLAPAPKKGESLVVAQSESYGFGWVADRTCDVDDMVWHNGAVDGYAADLTFLRDRGVGVVSLMNGVPGNAARVSRRILHALRRTGALSKRSAVLSPAFDPAMKKLLAVYNAWDEEPYRSMLRAGRNAVSNEREELEGYKALHGACTGYAPLEARTPLDATFAMQCERGPFEMRVTLWPDDGLIDGFVGVSRDAPIPKALRAVVDRITGLIRKWDPAVYAKHLALPGKTKADFDAEFGALRSAHGTCSLRSSTIQGFDRSFELECERGGDLALTLEIDAKDPNRVSGHSFRSAHEGACPVR